MELKVLLFVTGMASIKAGAGRSALFPPDTVESSGSVPRHPKNRKNGV
jgi:hypothetical protein